MQTDLAFKHKICRVSINCRQSVPKNMVPAGGIYNDTIVGSESSGALVSRLLSPVK